MRDTSAEVRISTPASVAAAASAAASAPGPPRAKTVWPGAPPSLPAESASSTAVVPADHGPIEVYWMARQAMAAWSASVSNDSATKSAIAIGRTRVIVRPSWLAQAAEGPAETQAGEGIAETGRFDVGRRLGGDLAQEPGQRPDETVEGGVVPGVGRGPGPEALGGPGRVAPQDDGPAVRHRARRPGRPARRATDHGGAGRGRARPTAAAARPCGPGSAPAPRARARTCRRHRRPSPAARGRPSAGRPCPGRPPRRVRCGRPRPRSRRMRSPRR